jgi:hypothetical protein
MTSKASFAMKFLLLSVTFTIGVLAAGQVGAAQAVSASDTPAPATDPMSQIPATLQGLREAKAGKYGKLRADDKQRLDAADRQIGMLISSHDDLSQLDAQERMQLFNAQETVMAIVSGLRRNELVCTYRANAGTRFKTKHCMTREMAEAMRKASREDLRAAQNPMCVPGEGQDCMNGLQELNRQGLGL